MMRSSAVALVVVLLLLSPVEAGNYFVEHTGADEPLAAPSEDSALVYWIRPSNLGSAVKTWAFVDDHVVGVTKARGYFFVNVPAGKHIFWNRAENVSAVEMEVLPGRTYYFEHDIRRGEMKAQVKQAPLTKEQGEAILATCKYTELTDEGRQRGAEIVAERLSRVQAQIAEDSPPAVELEAPSNTEGMVLVKAGLEVEVELMENLSSRHTTESEEILFRTTHDVAIDENLTVPAGWLVKGLVDRVDRASGGGDAGEVDVVIPSLVARDGTEIPVVGRVMVEGRDKHGKASNMAGGFGMLGWGLTKGKAAYVLAGETYTLMVRQDTWVTDRSEEEMANAEREASRAAEAMELKATSASITFEPESRKKVRDVVVVVETSDELSEVTVSGVGDLTLLDPVPAVQLKRRKGGRWELSFPGWSVLRFVRPDDRTVFDVPIRLDGSLSANRPFTATPRLSVSIEYAASVAANE
jgi:hypothetical protein